MSDAATQSYADLTVSDRNPVKRWLQRRRFADALALSRSGLQDNVRVMDYGAGDGELIRLMLDRVPIEPWIYEPAPHLIREAKEKLEAYPAVRFLSDLAEAPRASFDYIFCLEVLEHLPHEETIAALTNIRELLKPGGSALIGVPHELFLPGLIKGVFRMTRRYGSYDARPLNVLRATIGRLKQDRQLDEIGPGQRYFFYHLGFDHRVLESILRERFQSVFRTFSPFAVFGSMFNSEVYFVVQKS